MQTISQIYEAQIEVKKSTFIAFVCPFDRFKLLLENLKKEHTKAVHFVWAYRFLNEFGQIVEDKSDDGEPKGTSALPSLNVLRGFRLVNVAVIIVRYFGGVKLGTGGLVRAYSEAVNAAIAKVNLVSFKSQVKVSIALRVLSRFEHFLNKNKIHFKKEFKGDQVLLLIDLEPKEKKEFESFAKEFNAIFFEWYKIPKKLKYGLFPRDEKVLIQFAGERLKTLYEFHGYLQWTLRPK